MKTLPRLCVMLGLILSSIASQAQTNGTLNFVRIKGLSEQIVGERLLKEIYRRAEIPITITSMTGSRALEEASTGRKDGETLRIYAVGEKFPSLIRVPTPISDLTTIGFGIKKPYIALESKEDLEKYKVVRVRGVQHTKNITEGLKNVHVLPTADLFVEFLSRGRADVGLTGRLNGLSLVKTSGLKNVEIVGSPLRVLRLYHYIHEKHKNVVPKVDKVIQAMVSSGEMAQLRAQYEAEYLDAIKPTR